MLQPNAVVLDADRCRAEDSRPTRRPSCDASTASIRHRVILAAGRLRTPLFSGATSRYTRLRMWTSRLSITLAIASVWATVAACADEPGSDCTPGAAGCQCSTGQCFAGLACLSNICVSPTPGDTSASEEASASTDPTSSGSVSADPTATSDDGTADAATGGSTEETASGGCQGTDGTINCPCLAGNACQGDLTCDSQQTCICLSGDVCGESDCVDDFLTDDRHCGVCGNACAVFGNNTIGRCTLGECAPTMSNCAPKDGVTTCDAICEAEGRSCVEQGCGQGNNMFTWLDYALEDLCDTDKYSGGGFGACSEPPDGGLDVVRCCCTV